jgi:hypothetical protein
MVSQTKRGIVVVTKTGSHCSFDGKPQQQQVVPARRDPLYGG